MKKIKIKITENNNMKPCGHNIAEECGCEAAAPLPKNPGDHMHTNDCERSNNHENPNSTGEARMHRTTLAHLMADVKVLLDLVQDGDDLPPWLEAKITKAGDYMSSAARYIAGNIARDQGQLEEQQSVNMSMEREQMLQQFSQLNDEELARLLNQADLTQKQEANQGSLEEDQSLYLNETLIDDYYSLYEHLNSAVDEEGNTPCPECLYETILEANCGSPDVIEEATYQGKKVSIGKPKRGGSKKFYVYVKGCLKDKKKVKKISFGDPNMKIKKSNPKRRKSFRARHKCATAKDRCSARYWSCRKW